MSATKEHVSFQACIDIQDFFNENSLLMRACGEMGLPYKAAKSGQSGDVSKMKMIHAVFLGEWIALWRAQEAERRGLAEKVLEYTQKAPKSGD